MAVFGHDASPPRERSRPCRCAPLAGSRRAGGELGPFVMNTAEQICRAGGEISRADGW
jgi:hypothetical protein